MNTKKYYLIFMLVFLFLLLGTTISYGAYSASSSTVESGGKITVKVTSSEALDAYNLDLQSHEGLTFNSCSKTESGAIININGSSIGYMNMSGSTKDLGTYTFTAPSVTEDKKYTITFMVDKKTSVTSTITVKAPVVETPPETTTPEPEKPSTNTNTGTGDSTITTKPEETPKSSEARLKNFGIKPSEYDFSGFKKDKTEYSVSVPSNVESVEVYAEPVDNKAKVSGDGKVTLNEGNNKIGVKVTAEDGTTKTYTLTIKRKTVAEEEAENGENRLKSLSIKPEEYDFTGFNSETTEYTAEVPNEAEQIEIVATAMDSKAQVTGTGIIDLEEGENELKIEVIAVNGDKKTYTLTVTRKEAEAKEVLGLSTLSIVGLKLNPSFKVGVYEYTAELQEDLTSLEITAKANNEDATVEIVGNENLKEGENVITILVENEETKEVATYQITVNKNVAMTEEVIEQTSWLKPSTWGKEEIIKIIIIVVLIILIICAIILKKNISKESPKSKKMDLPGAEELDKAIAEHQELVDGENETIVEEMDIVENIDQKLEEQNYIEEIAKNKFAVEDYDEKPKRRGRHF